jgi:hypothetical protein
MYFELGSQWLSNHVKEQYTAGGGNPTNTVSSSELEHVINERAPLLMYDGQQSRPARDLKPSALESLKILNILEIPKIEIVREFKGIKKSQETTACIAVLNRSAKSTLLVTRDYDFFDVAK